MDILIISVGRTISEYGPLKLLPSEEESEIAIGFWVSQPFYKTLIIASKMKINFTSNVKYKNKSAYKRNEIFHFCIALWINLK